MTSSLVIAALSLLPMNAEISDSWTVSSSLNSLSYVENNSIYDFVKSNESDYQSGENAFTFNEFNLTSQYKNFSISYFSRYEWFFDYSKDTMALYGTTVNGTLIDTDKVYDLNLDVHHLNAEGIRLAYLYQLKDINLYFAASYLKGRELIEGNATGEVELTGSCGDGLECYAGDLDLSYGYSEDALFDRKVNAPKSKYGYGFDIGADWVISEKLFASIYIQDLLAAVVWDDAPYTDASATTATTTVENGKYKIDPVITGFEGSGDYKQTLPTKYNLLFSYQLTEQNLIYTQGFYSFGSTLFHLGYRFQHMESTYGLKLYPVEGAIGVEFKNKYLDISITSEPFDYQDTEIFAFKFGVTIPL